MTTRPLLLTTMLALAGCTSAPLPAGVAELSAPEPDGIADIAVPDSCRTAYRADPTYSQADISARIAERQASLPENTPIAPLTPVVRNGPQYPQCALSYGLEGYCDIVFDVLPDGTTTNILPVCSSRVFEREATYAVSRWTFEPPGDGPRPAMLNRVVFKIGDYYAAPALPAQQATETGPVTE